MNSLQYQEILEENVMESVTNLRLGRHWTFQQDNDPKHTSKSTRAWLKMKVKYNNSGKMSGPKFLHSAVKDSVPVIANA
uniref:Tc1-like transposase DDE domain-containing protein n=1 Tax=Pygocentrus nattereri TaxID=42514 RepID=A0AAR2LBS8_PYGNA